MIHHGDCIEWLRSLPDDAADVCLTDPPYEEEAHTKARRSLKDATQRKGAVNTGEVHRIDEAIEIAFPPITEAERVAVSVELARVTRRWVVAFCQIEAVGDWRRTLCGAGLDWVRGCVWRKPNGAPQFTGDRPGMGFECFAVAHRPGRKQWNGGGKHGFYEFPLEQESRGSVAHIGHPTAKLIPLMLQLVEDFSNPGETIIDPFAGSGTTGVAALRLGRKFIGAERDDKFHALAMERLAAEQQGISLAAARSGQVALFGGIK